MLLIVHFTLKGFSLAETGPVGTEFPKVPENVMWRLWGCPENYKHEATPLLSLVSMDGVFFV